MAKTSNLVNRIGALGEDIACRYLIGKGYNILDRNYRKKWGEIDIVAGSKGITYFVEVKSRTCRDVSIIDPDGFRPEENVHPMKMKRLGRVIQSYISERGVGEWQLDLLTIYIQEVGKLAKVERFENVSL